MRSHRRQPTRLPHPWDSPGKNTGVGCHFLLQCMKVKSESEVVQSCWLLATPWTAAYQAPLSMGYSRQEYWSGVPLPSLFLLTLVQLEATHQSHYICHFDKVFAGIICMLTPNLSCCKHLIIVPNVTFCISLLPLSTIPSQCSAAGNRGISIFNHKREPFPQNPKPIQTTHS